MSYENYYDCWTPGEFADMREHIMLLGVKTLMIEEGVAN